jgi:hypothetical protein
MTIIRVVGLALVSGAAVASSQGQKPSLQVCVGADRVLRYQAEGACPSGTTSYELSLEGDEIELPPKEEEKASEQRLEELRLKLDMLSSKLMDVQKELANAATVKAGGKVMAPFEVVDEAGKMIFRVRQDPRGFEMATGSGLSVAWGSALEAGGVFKTRSSASFPEVVMGSSGNFGGFAIRDGEQQARASLTLTNGKPSLELSNDNHVGIVSVMQGSSGGGFIQLGNATGTAMVQAGTTAGNCGRVEAFPLRPPAAVVGVAGSWIMGKGC